MTRKNNYDFPSQSELERIRKKLSNPNYEGGNIVVSEDAPVEEKMKYSVSQSILSYQQASKRTFKSLVEEIEIDSLTEKKLIDICRGKLTEFSFGELWVYANNLRITNIPCYSCGVNLYQLLLEVILSTLKEQKVLPLNVFYQAHAHQHLNH